MLPAVVKDKKGIEAVFAEALSEIAVVKSKHVIPEKLLKQALVAVQKNPALMSCTGTSWLTVFLTASEMGLDISGTTGEAWLVPYSGKVQYQIGYQGFITLAERSGKYASIQAHIVYENDVFDLDYANTTKPLTHKPCLDGDRGSVRGAYMLRVMKDGTAVAEWMPMKELQKIRNASKARNSPAWTDWEEEMMRKAPLKRGLKYAPKSQELIKAIDIDNEQFGIEIDNHVSKTDAVKQMMRGTTTVTVVEPEPEPAINEPVTQEKPTEPEPVDEPDEPEQPKTLNMKFVSVLGKYNWTLEGALRMLGQEYSIEKIEEVDGKPKQIKQKIFESLKNETLRQRYCHVRSKQEGLL